MMYGGYMGLFDGWTRRKRVNEAAQQMWNFIRRGYTFEVPLILDRNDLTLAAIVKLQKNHPEVELRMYQSKGLVLGIFRSPSLVGPNKIAPGTLDFLARQGNIGAGHETITAEEILADHEAFLRRQGLDPQQMEREAQEARMKEEAITVGEKATPEEVTPVITTSVIPTPHEASPVLVEQAPHSSTTHTSHE